MGTNSCCSKGGPVIDRTGTDETMPANIVLETARGRDGRMENALHEQGS